MKLIMIAIIRAYCKIKYKGEFVLSNKIQLLNNKMVGFKYQAKLHGATNKSAKKLLIKKHFKLNNVKAFNIKSDTDKIDNVNVLNVL